MKGNQSKIETIIKDLRFVIKHTEKIKVIEDLNKEEILLDCILFRIIQISENANKITNEFKVENVSIPWGEIKGLRNRVVHDYGNVNLLIIFRVIKIYLPSLLESFEKLIEFDSIDKYYQK